MMEIDELRYQIEGMNEVKNVFNKCLGSDR